MQPVWGVVDLVFQEEVGLEPTAISCVRPWDTSSLHPYGFAIDFGVTLEVSSTMWEKIRQGVQDRLGMDFGVACHGEDKKKRLHVDFDYRLPKEMVPSMEA